MQKLFTFPQTIVIFLSLLVALTLWLGTTTPAMAQDAPNLASSSGGGLFGLKIFVGNQPTNLGVDDGKLAPCPNTPNCVSSQSRDDHKIEPLTFNTTPDEAFAKLKRILESSDRATIISQAPDYLYAEFSSKILGFVDDVEFYLDRDNYLIHTRSASRLGQSDLGVNRKRIEGIRAKLQDASNT